MAEEDKVPVGDNYICNKCSGFLGHTLNENGNRGDHACCVCLGLWEDHAASIQQAIDKACEPYGGVETNRFSTDEAPSVAIPGDIALRYHLAFSLEGSRAATELADFLRHLKSHVKNVALDYVMSRQATSLEGYPPCVKREEQGYLCVHILLTPSSEVNRPSNVVLSVNKKHRKRFRGNELNDKQGGDPRRNLESRLRKQGVDVWPCVDVETLLAGSVPPDTLKAWSGWFRTSATAPRLSVQYNVAVWRKPFFLRGLYTKARRDVSQTPFYVPSDKDASIMQRLGVTSVEEQILPVLTNVACGGISTLNADPNRDDLVFSMDQVLQVPQKINCTDSENSNACDDNDELAGRRYGRNPLGVDISDSFTFVPSIAFKNLQSDTEEKVKYYGCLCWSGRAISSQEELQTRLGTFPLELNQKTPIRVLHRRSRSTRVRRVLSLRATLIDAHHFRLNLSTDAGTYVKEFAHGDLGRTVPSVSSLLECKVDMLELDCEGIAGVYFCPS